MISPIEYIDRRTGGVKVEKIHASRFLDWAYNTQTGALAGPFLFRSPIASLLYGLWNRSPLSKGRISRFIREMDIDVSCCPQPITAFSNFSDFFRRSIDPAARPVASDAEACVSPADGKLLVYRSLGRDEQITVKRHRFSLEELLSDGELAEHFHGGAVAIIRITLADYHHFHFPDAGIPGQATAIRGAYNACGPYGAPGAVPFYSHNYRMRTIFASDTFGPIAMVEVGAFAVGSIVQTYSPNQRISRGDEKGYFELGGSTIVLVFRPGSFEPDDDLLRNSSRGFETSVQMGESIGRRPR